MTWPHLQCHPSFTQTRISGTRPRPLLIPHSPELPSPVCGRSQNLRYSVPTQSSDPLSSPSEPWSSVSPPPHEVTLLTAVTQATTRTEVLEGRRRMGGHWRHILSNVSFHSQSGVTLWFMVRFSSHIYARLSVARQIHDLVDDQEAIQAYKAEMINHLVKKKSGT